MAGSSLTLGVIIGGTVGSAFEKTVGKAKADLSTVGIEAANTSSALKNIHLSRTLPRTIESTSAKLKKQESKTQELEVAYKKAFASGAKKADELKLSYNAAKTKSESLANTLDNQKRQQQRVNSSLKEAGVNTNDLSGETLRLKNTLERQKDAAQRQSRSMQRRKVLLGDMKAQVGKLVATWGTLTKSLQASLSFETAMTNIEKLAGPKGMDKLGDAITRVSGNLGKSATEMANLVATGAQARVPRDELVKFAETAEKLGEMMDSSAQEGADMLAKWRTSMNLNQGQALQLADQITLLGASGKTSSKDIATMVNRLGAMGEMSHISAGAMAALAASFPGSDASRTTRNVRKLLNVLQAGENITTKQQKGFKALGLDAKVMAKVMQTDASAGLKKVFQHLQSLDSTARNNAIRNLFGDSATESFAPLLNNMGLLQKNLDKVADKTQWQGQLDADWTAHMADASTKLSKLGTTFSNVGKIIGDVFLPPLGWVANTLANVLGGVVVLSQKFPHLTQFVVGTVGGFVLLQTTLRTTYMLSKLMPFTLRSVGRAFSFTTLRARLFNTILTLGKGVLLLFRTSLGVAGSALKVFSGALSFAGTTFKWIGRIFLTNPIGLAITAIAVGAYLIIRYWSPIKAFFSKVFGAIGASIDRVVDKFKAIMHSGSLLGSVLKVAFWPITLAVKAVGKLIGAFKAVKNSWLGKKVSGWFGGDEGAGTNGSSPVGTAMASANDSSPAIGDSTRRAESAGDHKVIQLEKARLAKGLAGKTAPAKPATMQQHNEFAITIAAAPGMDEDAIAKKVADAIADQQRAQARQQRSALFDVG